MPRTAYFERSRQVFHSRKETFCQDFLLRAKFWQKFLSKKCLQFPPNIIIWKLFSARLLHTSLRSRTKFLSCAVAIKLYHFDSELDGRKVLRINPNDRSSSLISFILLQTIIRLAWLGACFVKGVDDINQTCRIVPGPQH